MPVVSADDTVVHELHGSRFTSYAAPSRGSKELCAWRLEVQPGSQGVPHTVSREEVLYMLTGTLLVSLDGDQATSKPGDAIVVPPGTTFRVDNPSDEPASAWVTTSAGLEATLSDGSTISPPWVR
jgi:quercetin dioxygenase-like cupin family protein